MKKKAWYCVYFNESREQFHFMQTERALKHGISQTLILSRKLSKENAVLEASLLNREYMKETDTYVMPDMLQQINLAE